MLIYQELNLYTSQNVSMPC